MKFIMALEVIKIFQNHSYLVLIKITLLMNYYVNGHCIDTCHISIKLKNQQDLFFSILKKRLFQESCFWKFRFK